MQSVTPRLEIPPKAAKQLVNSTKCRNYYKFWQRGRDNNVDLERRAVTYPTAQPDPVDIAGSHKDKGWMWPHKNN